MNSNTCVRLLALACAVSMLAIAAPGASADLLAPRSACPGQQNIDATEHLQEDALRCLIAHARERAGVQRLGSNSSLERSAGRKAGDVMRCGFAHTACGNSADKWAHEYGYSSGTSSWRFGENLAWGRGKRGSARNVLEAWFRSSPHRATLFTGSFEHLGIGLRRGGFAGHRNASVWVLQVGCRGC